MWLIALLVALLLFYIFDPLKLFVSDRPTKIYDCGYTSMARGWYDFRNQGVKNDFCRFVGDAPNITFTCQLGNDPAKDNVTSVLYDPTAEHEPFDSSLYTCKWPAP